MIKNECRHAYKMLDKAECLWCEDCVEKLVKRIQAPKVNRLFLEIWEANFETGLDEGIPIKRMLKDTLISAGIKVKY